MVSLTHEKGRPMEEKEHYFSNAHKEYEKFSEKESKNLLDAHKRKGIIAMMHSLGDVKGIYHPTYRRTLTAREESWLKQYDAVDPRELI